MPTQKYIRTARLGEGVIYVAGPDKYHAAIIIEQNSETVVNLLVIDPNGGLTRVVRDVHLDGSATKVGCWAWRPKA